MYLSTQCPSMSMFLYGMCKGRSQLNSILVGGAYHSDIYTRKQERGGRSWRLSKMEERMQLFQLYVDRCCYGRKCGPRHCAKGLWKKWVWREWGKMVWLVAKSYWAILPPLALWCGWTLLRRHKTLFRSTQSCTLLDDHFRWWEGPRTWQLWRGALMTPVSQWGGCNRAGSGRIGAEWMRAGACWR